MLETMIVLVLGLATGMGVSARMDRRRPTATRDMRIELAAELERARRYGGGFQLARIGLSDAPSSRRSAAMVAVRRTDRIWRDGTDLIVLLPECGDAALEGWQHRFEQQLGEQDVSIRTACFPRDGLTLDALLARLDVLPTHDEQPVAIRVHDRAAS
jgi:hypothetical protein